MRRRDFVIPAAGILLANGCSRDSSGVAARGNGPKKLALLVGIDRYRSSGIRQLQGCRNDVEAMRRALIGSHGFSDTDIRVLTDEKASYNGIVGAFKDMIAQAAAGKITAGDILVFHYSGHGSRQPSAASASGEGESLVPYDSRDPKNLDITAEALSSLLAQLAKTTKNITVILDSCHSGRMVGVTRGLNDIVEVREIPPATEPAPPPPFPPPASRSLADGRKGFNPLDDSYVLLASALPSQTAKEYASGGKSYGAMTFFLLREISAPPPTVTYRNIMDIVALRVAEAVANQTPQVVGPNLDRYLFGLESPPAAPYTLARREGNVVRLPFSGAAHGVAEGARYDVYAAPPQASSSAVANIEVTRVFDFDCEAKTLTGSVPEIGYAVLRDRGVNVGPLRVWIDASPRLNEVREQLRAAKRFQVSAERASVNVQVVAEPVGIGLYTPDGLPLFDSAAPIRDGKEVVQELERWANWFAILALNNVASDLKIKLKLEPVSGRGPEPLVLPQLGKPDMVLKEKSVIEPVVTNESDQTLYIALLALSSDRSIGVVFPNKGDQNASFELKPRSPRRLPPIRATVPGCLKSSRDVLTLFASTQPVRLFEFEQDGFCGSARTLKPDNLSVRGWPSNPGKWCVAKTVVEIRR